MKRRLFLLCIIMVIALTLSSCQYPGYEFIDGTEDNVVIAPSDGRYVEATPLDVVIPSLVQYGNLSEKDIISSSISFFTDFLSEDGMLSLISDEVGVPTPDLVLRPRAISASLRIDASDEALMLGSRYKDYSSIDLEHLGVNASGNTSDLVALVLHSMDSHEWPMNQPLSGSVDIDMRLRLEKGEDAGDSIMPLAFLSLQLSLELENVEFSYLTVNGVDIPLPKFGSVRIKAISISFASSHITIEEGYTEFPALGGEDPIRKTVYHPYSISLKVEPGVLFDANKAYNAAKGMITQPEVQDAYWSLLARIVWGRFDGDHITLSMKTYDGVELPLHEDIYRDLLILQLLGV